MPDGETRPARFSERSKASSLRVGGRRSSPWETRGEEPQTRTRDGLHCRLFTRDTMPNVHCNLKHPSCLSLLGTENSSVCRGACVQHMQPREHSEMNDGAARDGSVKQV